MSTDKPRRRAVALEHYPTLTTRPSPSNNRKDLLLSNASAGVAPADARHAHDERSAHDLDGWERRQALPVLPPKNAAARFNPTFTADLSARAGPKGPGDALKLWNK
jgi:hypothetical protein